jgi:hypothetical protein
MASDVRPPADNSHLHADPAKLARYWDGVATMHWGNACSCGHAGTCDDRMNEAEAKARYYRRLADAGERVPEF